MYNIFILLICAYCSERCNAAPSLIEQVWVGLVKFNLQERTEQRVELSILVLLSGTIFLTILNIISDDALLCGMRKIAFINFARFLNLPSLSMIAQNLSILASSGSSALPATWYSTTSALRLSRSNLSCGSLFPCSITVNKKWTNIIITYLRSPWEASESESVNSTNSL